MDVAGIVTVEIRSYGKYKARSDVKSPSWFKSSNRIFEDDDLFDFSLEEMAVWWYILALSSQQQSSVVRLSYRKAAVRIKRELLDQTIRKLADLQILTVSDPDAVRGRNVHVPDADRPRTVGEEGLEGLDKRGGEGGAIAPEAPPANFNGSQSGNLCGVLPELAGNSARELALQNVSQELQREWIETYDLKWLKDSLLHAIERSSQGAPVDLVSNWQERFTRWFKIEKKPKFKSKPSPERQRSPQVPFPSGEGKLRAFQDPELAAQLRKVKSV